MYSLTLKMRQTNFQVYFTWWDRWMNSVYNGPHTLYSPPAKAKSAGAPLKLDTKERARASGREFPARASVSEMGFPVASPVLRTG